MSAEPPVTTILFLAANPQQTSVLRLDQELREIEAGLRRSQYRDRFSLEQRWATRPRDIQRALLDVNPQVVHFSGHGEGEQGLVLEDETGQPQLVDGAALAGLFELFANQISCVLLNACYSVVQAEAIARHIPFVIGMNQPVGDRAAVEFAIGFYDALGAGRNIEFAYKAGCSAIRLAGLAENRTPALTTNPYRKLAPVGPEHPAFSPTPATLIKPPPPASTVTARQRQRIEQELSSLQQQVDLVSERLDRLRQAWAIETEVTNRFKLEKQMEQTETERNRIHQTIETLEQKL